VSRFIYYHAEWRYADCRYAECHYAECRYAECRGAVKMSLKLSMFERRSRHHFLESHSTILGPFKSN